MNNKIFLWTLLFLLCSTFSLAALTDDLKVYYQLDETTGVNAKDSLNYTNLTGINTPSWSPGIIGYSAQFDGVNEYLWNNTNASVKTYGNISISAWINNSWATYKTGECYPDDIGAERSIVGIDNTDGDVTYVLMLCQNTSGTKSLVVLRNKDAVASTFYMVPFNPNTNSWHHVGMTYDVTNGNITIYVNGTAQGSSILTGNGTGSSKDYIAIGSGASNDESSAYFNGTIDEVGIWQRVLSPAEMNQIYNFGTGLSYPFTATSTNFSVTATDEWNGTALNITVFVDGINYGTNITVTTGLYKNDTNTHNVTITSTNYFNRTYYNLNIASDLAGQLHMAEVCFNASQKVSNNSLTPNNFTILTTTKTSCFNISSGTFNVKATKTNWYNQTQSFLIVPLQNSTETVTGMYSTLANISVFQSNGTILSIYGINITSVTYPSWSGEIGSTTNGSYYFGGINGTYHAIINSSLGTESFDFTITATEQDHSYYYFSLNNCTSFGTVVLNFSIYEEDTKNLLNDSELNIWLNVTSSLYVGERQFNLSYSTGNYYLVCQPNGSTTNFSVIGQMRYSNLPTYIEKNYYFWNYPLSAITTTIPLYLTNATTQTKLQVRDYADDGIADVYIKVLSYDLATNTYTTTEILKTDSSGDAYAQLVFDTKWYAFILEQNGLIILQTLPTKVTSTPRTFRITSGADYFDNYDSVQGMSTTLTYNAATTTFSMTYSDPTGAIQQGCLKLTKRTINGDTLLNTSCVVSSAGTILMNLSDSIPGSNMYIAESYATIGSSVYSLDSLSQSFNTTYKTFGGSGLFFSFLIILVLVFVGIWHPAAAIVLMVFGVVVTNVLGLFYMNYTYIVVFVLLAVITLYRTSRSEN